MRSVGGFSKLIIKDQLDGVNMLCDSVVLAIEDIKASLNFTEWSGDPCLPNPHPWVVCSTSAPPEITAV